MVNVKNSLSKKSLRLSPRETEILTLTAGGKTRDEISIILSIKAVTVRAHLDGARRKLNATNIIQAAVLAYAYGLIEPLGTNLLKKETIRTENTNDRSILVIEHSHKKTRKRKT